MRRLGLPRLGLTRRGRSLLTAGLTAAIVGTLFGESELVRGGVFVAVVPLIASAVVNGERLHVSVLRRTEPEQVMQGERAMVQLAVTSHSALPTTTLMLEDALPPAVTGRARFVLARLRPEQTRTLGYRLPELPRGRHDTGPLRIRLVDPFGLIDRSRSFASRSSVLVTPVVEPLPGRGGVMAGGFGEGAASALMGSSGIDDLSSREYREGDDLRRIHWRLTARAGALMVRQDEQPTPNDITLLLDLRAIAHAGQAVDATWARPPVERNSFEWLMRAAASVGVNLLGAQRAVTLSDHAVEAELPRFATSADLLGYLASLTPRQDVRVGELIDAIATRAGRTTVVALLVGLDEPTTERLRILGSGRSASCAIILDPEAFRRGPALSAEGSEPTALLTAQVAELRAAGWRVAVAGPHDAVATVWGRLNPSGAVTR